LKLLPPLTIPEEALLAAIDILRDSLQAVLAGTTSAAEKSMATAS
jgi:hypothetical protein